jgi:glycosyltransferase involved in cell wall biosynthesis
MDLPAQVATGTRTPLMDAFRPLILIPSYNTGPDLLRETVRGALGGNAPVRVVIDGSTDGSFEALRPMEAEHPRLHVSRLSGNSGKGSAVLHGLREALAEGFTHILTMDADGQHPAAAIARFLNIGRQHPEAMVLGSPVFDETAPALRVGGRKISNFWANFETLGWGINDSLFGMRLYPAAELLAVMESTRFARRFDFDPEVAVRLVWRGVPAINLPTPVRYLSRDEGGVSQFRYIRDNTLLTWMHTRLLFGFVIRLPWLLARGGNPLEHATPHAP